MLRSSTPPGRVRSQQTERSALVTFVASARVGPVIVGPDASAALEMAAAWAAAARRIVVVTGAGISTDSGIPDFRGPNGLWTKNPAAEKASSLPHYLADAEVRRAAWAARLASPLWRAEPNAGHHAIVDIERQGRLHALVTQNTDGLHQRAGSDPELVIEVHGTAWWTRCWACGDRRPMAETLERVRRGDPRPVVRGVRRRDPQERHHLVRPAARARGDRAGAARVRHVRPVAGRRLDAQRLPGGQLRAPRRPCRGARRDRERIADRDGPASPTSCCAVRSPTFSPPSSAPGPDPELRGEHPVRPEAPPGASRADSIRRRDHLPRRNARGLARRPGSGQLPRLHARAVARGRGLHPRVVLAAGRPAWPTRTTPMSTS